MTDTQDRNVFLVRCGEVALKGLNKPYFERMLVERIRKMLGRFDGVEVKRQEGLVFIRADRKHDPAQIVRTVSRVFGVASISPAVEVPSDLDKIGEAAVACMKKRIETDGIRTFKIEAKRADKTFPVQSPEIARIIGAAVLKGCGVLKVDVHDPDCLLFVDLRKDSTYLFDQKIAGFGGLPLGTNGKGMALLSGGIDSPVATFMMAKRGMRIEAVHFHSYPYTSRRAQEKVEELARIVATYCGRFTLHVINLLPIQEEIVTNCPEEETTILVRRFMMKIAERIAADTGCGMLITGENLGQVASQTAEALTVTDESVQMPVMRPLIALDKVDIMDIAREIGTYETSVLPYEDCCTVFLPKHPVTKPKLERILQSEGRLETEALIEKAIAGQELVEIRPQAAGL